MEQSMDDANSVVFDTAPLAADLEILGAGALKVRVAATKPVAHLAIRLCEVTPEGKSWLVTYGILNLTHREGHEHPIALIPGHAYDVEIPLNFTAHRFRAGTKIRAAISESLWPLVWPSPEVAALSLDLGATALELPVRTAPAAEAPMPIALAPPLPSEPKGWPAMDIKKTGRDIRVVETWPPSTGEVAEIGETLSGSGPNVVLSMKAGDPLSCVWSAEQSAGYRRPGWDVAIKARVDIHATAKAFQVEERTLATLNGEIVLDLRHKETIPRHLA
jgi:hypothetical protein